MSPRCDLHTHSTASDGRLEPGDLVRAAHDENVAVLALTDHDDVSGIPEARAEGDRLGIEVVPGIELTVRDEAADAVREMHILGLGIDPEHAELRATLVEMRAERQARGAEIVRRLREHGVAIDFDLVQEIAGPGVIGRPHVARALVRVGAAADVDEAFARWLRRGRPGYTERRALGSRRAIGLIHAAGGIASLAHPPRSRGVDAPGGLASFVDRLVRRGLDALEVHHPAHGASQVKRLRRLVREHGLVETGGSDFHGDPEAGIRLGRGRGRGMHLGLPFWERVREAVAARAASPRV